MRKYIKRALFFMLCTVLLFSAMLASLPQEKAEARTIYDIESELAEYNNMLSKLKSELASITSDLSKVDSQSGQTSADLQKYQTEIDLLEAEIGVNTAISESYDLKRSEVYSQILITQEDYDYRMAMYKSLMQFIYENSTVNSFELLFSSDSLSDFLTRRDNFNSIMECADALIKEMESSLADLELLNTELAEAQSKYDTYLAELNASKLNYQSKVEQLETIASELGVSYESLSAKYSNTNATVKEVKAKISALEKEREEYYNSNSDFIWPLKRSVSYRVTSYFGTRNDPFGLPKTEFHYGIDIACAKNSPIIASKGGTVTKAEWYGGYGNCVIVYHGNGISTLYAHMTSIASGIKAGVNVKQGDLLGYVGTTGRSTGYHLHFGVIYNGSYVDPDDYLPNGFYTKK